ncbi:Cell division control protein 42 [Colletotrichum fructicola]|nr:Cell division control protein 42 [Colletotrichum fructicola]
MADPLSIAASIAGLLAAAGKVYTVVSGFIDSTANAPQSAAATLEAVGEIKLALSSVQSMIDSLHHLSASRKGLIQLEHLAIIITNAVFTLSKLESLVCQKDGFRVLQSHSNAEALLCYDEMLVKMEEVLEQNRTLGQHLRLMEDRGPLDVRSVKFMDDAMSIMSSRRSLRIVSAFRLPITLNDVHLVAPGSTFSAMFMEQALPTRPQGKLRRATMQNTSYPKPAMAWNRQTSIRSLISTSMETPEIPVARKVPSMESSRALPKIKVVVIGDSNALKSKMIHTFMGDAPVAAHADIPKGSDCSRSTVKVNDIYVDLELHDTTGVEDYSSLLNMACSEVDVFLFLSRKYSDTQFQSVGERWVPEISGIFPGVPYLVVGTHEGRDEEILDEDLAKFAASSVRGRKLAEALESVRYVDCDVGDVQAVQALIGQWWLQRR